MALTVRQTPSGELRPPEISTVSEYIYNPKAINRHTVYLANAVHKGDVTRLADTMISRLKRNNVHIRMFLVSSLAFTEDYGFLTSPLTPNNCLFDTLISVLAGFQLRLKGIALLN